MATKKKAAKKVTKKVTGKVKKAPGKVKKVAKKVAKKVTRKVQPIPKGYTAVTPHLVVDGAAKAIEFYKKAFGAKDLGRMEGPDGRVLHAEIQIGDARVMLSDEYPEMGSRGPLTIGGTPGGLMLYVRDVDACFDRALAAGATEMMPVTDMFWGDRYGKLQDPFGHTWALATHVEDVTPREMSRRAAEAARMSGG